MAPAREIVAAVPAYIQPALEPLLPRFIVPRWYKTDEQAVAEAQGVEWAWYDSFPALTPAIENNDRLSMMFTVASGIEHIPAGLLKARHISLVNGAGLNAANVADYALLGILSAAKGFAEVLKAGERREWLPASPGRIELDGTHALILGYGAIGRAIGARLSVCGVEVVGVRASPSSEEGVIGPNDWRSRLSEFDWIVIAAPSTRATVAMISDAEFADMKPSAWVVNVARGNLIDHDALRRTLSDRKIGGAFLDVTDPEPLPSDDALWSLPNAIITMHLSGRSQTGLLARGAKLFAENLERHARGERVRNLVDLDAHC